MFKKVFFLGLSAGILATVACLVYSKMYYSILVDFSEAAGIVKLLSNCMLATMVGCFVYFGLSKMFKKAHIAEFLFNLLITLATIGLVFYILKSDDPTFKEDSDAALMSDYYKTFLMPMLFFPALAWVTLKPLFVKA